jgi:hypothetical protein
MAAPPKTKPPSPAPPSARDRTSAVVSATLILLTVLGIVTVFWEPLTALAVGAPAGGTVGESHAPAADGGASAPASPSVETAADGSTSS